MNPTHGVLGGVMQRSGCAVKQGAEPHDTVMRAAATTGANGDGRHVLACALGFSEGGYQVFTHLNFGVIAVHKKLFA